MSYRDGGNGYGRGDDERYGGANRLAEIFGTEKDRVNCPFYLKIGACRHGERCSRVHNRPSVSQTLLLPNLWVKPVAPGVRPRDDGSYASREDEERVNAHFDDFYEDVFDELSSHGEIQMMSVCENTAEHMSGNVYVKFRDEEAAEAAFSAVRTRFYEGRPVLPEYCPVTDFREATCRQYEEEKCTRGGNCNFMHIKHASRLLSARLFERQMKKYRENRAREREREREREYDTYCRGRSRSRSRSRDRSQSRERETSEERRARIASWNRSRKSEPEEHAD